MISLSPYQSTWPDEFQKFGIRLRHNLGTRAVRIDHIGSTSVPGLAAKDILDVQVTVEALSPAVEQAIVASGYRRVVHISCDHVPPACDPDPAQWEKWFFKGEGERPINLHVRIVGRANQRYALLFRDYLRNNTRASRAYEQVKSSIIRYHPEEKMDAYYDIKDPVCDIIMSGAETWAAATAWCLGESDC
ncbi:MAG: GrpB family protein [Planctomycetota bacterium]